MIGRNGSGKSTLLRCVAGIHEPDAGEVEVHARVAPFIELGVGFHPQLAAADNVLVAGTLMGLRPSEARRRFPSVIEFAELEDFIEMPIANYSSGMQVRLAFSTSFQVDAELLLFDEVLAVGDELFRRKCTDHVRAPDRSRPHDHLRNARLETVTQFADRVPAARPWRGGGAGRARAVLDEYKRRNREYERARARRPSAVRRRSQQWERSPDTLRPGVAAPEPSRSVASATVVFTLARAEFKLRYLDSVIGYLWSLGQPLLLYLVL